MKDFFKYGITQMGLGTLIFFLSGGAYFQMEEVNAGIILGITLIVIGCIQFLVYMFPRLGN